MTDEIFSYEVTDHSLNLQNRRQDITIQAEFPCEYSELYNFSRIMMFASGLKKENKDNNKGNMLIKKLFFNVLKCLPGDLSDYSLIRVISENGEVAISYGKLRNYINNQAKEIIEADSCIMNLEDFNDSQLDYYYCCKFGKNDRIKIGDTMTNPYCMYPRDKDIPSEVLEAYSMYVKAFLNHFNDDLTKLNNARKEKKLVPTKKRKI